MKSKENRKKEAIKHPCFKSYSYGYRPPHLNYNSLLMACKKKRTFFEYILSFLSFFMDRASNRGSILLSEIFFVFFVLGFSKALWAMPMSPALKINWNYFPSIKVFEKQILANSTFKSLVAGTKSQRAEIKSNQERPYNLLYKMEYENYSSYPKRVFTPQSRVLKHTLMKNFSSGTSLSLRYTENKTKNLNLENLPKFYSQNILDSYSFDLSQDLTQNFLTENLDLRVQDRELLNSSLEAYESLEDFLIKTVEHYYSYQVAKVNYKIFKDVGIQYKQLNKEIVQKKKIGFLKPGEWELFQLEWSQFKRNFKVSHDIYKTTLQQTLVFFNVSQEKDLPKIEVPYLKLPPLKFKVAVETLRPFLVLNNQRDNSQDKINQKKRNLLPSIKVGARRNYYPKFTDGKSLSYNTYFLSLSYNLSFWQSQKDVEKFILQKFSINEKLESLKDSLIVEKKHLKNSLSTSYYSLKSSYSEVKYAKSFLEESRRNYQKAQIELDRVVASLQSYRTSLVNHETQKKDYILLYLKWLCFSDQIIPTGLF